jgi:hypothetical protein
MLDTIAGSLFGILRRIAELDATVADPGTSSVPLERAAAVCGIPSSSVGVDLVCTTLRWREQDSNSRFLAIGAALNALIFGVNPFPPRRTAARIVADRIHRCPSLSFAD